MIWKSVMAVSFAGIVATPVTPLEPWMQLGISGILAFIIWFIIAKIMPQKDAAHNETVANLAASMQECSAKHTECSTRIEHAIRDGNAEQLKLLKVATGLREETKT